MPQAIIWSDEGTWIGPGPAALTAILKGREARSTTLQDTYCPLSTNTPGRLFQRSTRAIEHPIARYVPEVRKAEDNGLLSLIQGALEAAYRVIDLKRAVHDPFYALSPFFRLAAASEMDLIQLIDTTVRDELNLWDNVAGAGRNDARPKLENILYNQQVLKRHIQYLKSTIRCLSTWASVAPADGEGLDQGSTNYQRSDAEEILTQGPVALAANPKESATLVKLILADYQHALRCAETVLQDCAQAMSVAAHRASVRESEKAMAEAHDVTKLTRLATVFIPLTFVTSVFGMNIRELGDEDGPPVWVFVVCSVVLGFVTWAVLVILEHYWVVVKVLWGHMRREFGNWRWEGGSFWKKVVVTSLRRTKEDFETGGAVRSHEH